MFQEISGVRKRRSPEEFGGLLFLGRRNQGRQAEGGEVVPPSRRTGKCGSSEVVGRLLLFWRRNHGGQAGGGEVVPSGRRTGKRGSSERSGRLL